MLRNKLLGIHSRTERKEAQRGRTLRHHAAQAGHHATAATLLCGRGRRYIASHRHWSEKKISVNRALKGGSIQILSYSTNQVAVECS